MLEVGEFGKAGEEVEYLGVVGMENMGAVGMDRDSVFIAIIVAVARHVPVFLYDEDALSALREDAGRSRARKPRSDDDSVEFHLFSRSLNGH